MVNACAVLLLGERKNQRLSGFSSYKDLRDLILYFKNPIDLFKISPQMSYRQIIYHIVFSTKNRETSIANEHCEQLYMFIWGISKNKNCKLYRINGIEDHIHLLVDLHPSIALADYVKDIKVASNLWMKESGKFPEFGGWQVSYGAFTYSVKEKHVLINYIKNQKIHHCSESSIEEFRRMLVENEVDFDESYLL